MATHVKLYNSAREYYLMGSLLCLCRINDGIPPVVVAFKSIHQTEITAARIKVVVEFVKICGMREAESAFVNISLNSVIVLLFTIFYVLIVMSKSPGLLPTPLLISILLLPLLY